MVCKVALPVPKSNVVAALPKQGFLLVALLNWNTPEFVPTERVPLKAVRLPLNTNRLLMAKIAVPLPVHGEVMILVAKEVPNDWIVTAGPLILSVLVSARLLVISSVVV